MAYIDLVEQWSKFILFFMLPCLGFLGVALHWWFSYRLSFFDFHGDKSSNKKSLRRIIIPWLIVGGLSAIVPIGVESSHADLHECLSRGELVEYIRFPWNYFLPVIAMEISIITCFIIGSLCYFIIGLLTYSISILLILNKGT